MVLDLIGTLHKVHVKAGGCMPGDVAVEGPDTGVVGIVLKDVVAVAANDMRVTACWVRRIGDSAVPFAVTGGKFVHVMA